jgi:hypothetical protein
VLFVFLAGFVVFWLAATVFDLGFAVLAATTF